MHECSGSLVVSRKSICISVSSYRPHHVVLVIISVYRILFVYRQVFLICVSPFLMASFFMS